MHIRLSALQLLTACGILVAHAMAQDLEANRATVRGLDAVFVAVEKLDPESRAHGLSEDQVRKEAEAHLSGAGLVIRSRGEYDVNPDKAMIYIRISSMKDGPCFAFTVHLALRQEVMLVRNPEISIVTETWSAGGVGAIPDKNLKAAALEAVNSYIDRFIRAWKAAPN